MNLKKASSFDFDLIYSEMQKSFIREEIRDRDTALALMSEKNYSMYHLLEGDARVGFLAIW